MLLEAIVIRTELTNKVWKSLDQLCSTFFCTKAASLHSHCYSLRKNHPWSETKFSRNKFASDCYSRQVCWLVSCAWLLLSLLKIAPNGAYFGSTSAPQGEKTLRTRLPLLPHRYREWCCAGKPLTDLDILQVIKNFLYYNFEVCPLPRMERGAHEMRTLQTKPVDKRIAH